MSRLLTEDQVVKEIKKRQGSKRFDEFAQELGISEVWLRNLYINKKPGPKVLKTFGFKRVFRYEVVEP